MRLTLTPWEDILQEVGRDTPVLPVVGRTPGLQAEGGTVCLVVEPLDRAGWEQAGRAAVVQAVVLCGGGGYAAPPACYPWRKQQTRPADTHAAGWCDTAYQSLQGVWLSG